VAHYTAKIHLGHETGRNPVLQRVPARQSAMLGPWLGWRMHFGQLKRREFITLLGGFGPVSLPLFQAGRSGLAFDEEGLLSFMVSLRSAITRSSPRMPKPPHRLSAISYCHISFNWCSEAIAIANAVGGKCISYVGGDLCLCLLIQAGNCCCDRGC